MYDELVNRLRELHPEEFGDAWDFAFACQQAMHEAADAIEELSVIVRAQKYVLDQAPHWIPVEDYLPINGEEIITLGPNGGMECGFFCGLCGTRKDKWEWKKHTGRTVKFWMSRKALPEPPKEET